MIYTGGFSEYEYVHKMLEVEESERRMMNMDVELEEFTGITKEETEIAEKALEKGKRTFTPRPKRKRLTQRFKELYDEVTECVSEKYKKLTKVQKDSLLILAIIAAVAVFFYSHTLKEFPKWKNQETSLTALSEELAST